MNLSQRRQSGIAAWLRGAAMAACLCAAASSSAQAGTLILVPEGPVTLIRGTTVFDAEAPFIAAPGDMLATDAHEGAQLEDSNGTLLALGPQTRLAIAPTPRAPGADGSVTLSLLTGWVKISRPPAAPQGTWTIDTPALHTGISHGSAVIHTSSAATALFVETGSVETSLPDTATAPLNVAADRYLERDVGKPPVPLARPRAAFVSELPVSFRDPLAASARRAQKVVTPTQGRLVAYAEIADWLACSLPVRKTMVARLRPLAPACA